MLSRLVAGILLALFGLALVSAQDIYPASDPNVQPYAGTPVSGYQLAWSDEFNGAAINEGNWNYRMGVRFVANVPATSAWSDYRIVDIGEIESRPPGVAHITARAADNANWKALNLRDVQLLPGPKE